MIRITIILVVTVLSSCSLNSTSIVSNESNISEEMYINTCKSCGQVHKYLVTFDDLDYSLIAKHCDDFGIERKAYWIAPQGPEPSCDSSYDALAWSYLKEELPSLRRDTFESFKRRNTPIPMHKETSSIASNFGIKIVKRDGDARRFARGGFSENKKQALLYSGGGVLYMYEFKDNAWKEVKRAILWMM